MKTLRAPVFPNHLVMLTICFAQEQEDDQQTKYNKSIKKVVKAYIKQRRTKTLKKKPI